MVAGLVFAPATLAVAQGAAPPETGPEATDTLGTVSPPPAGEAYTPPPGGYPSPAWQAVKSMVLPGWGQVGNGAYWKAPICLGAYAGFIAWGVSINQDVQDAQGLLNENRGGADEYYYQQEVDRLTSSRDAKYWLAGLTLVLSMADAFVDASLRDFDKRIDADVAWIPGAGLGLGVTVGWDAVGER